MSQKPVSQKPVSQKPVSQKPYKLPLLTMSDILWDHRIVRVSRPEGYGCGCCSALTDAFIQATTTCALVVAIINLPCGCITVGGTYWRATPEVLTRLILVAEEIIL